MRSFLSKIKPVMPFAFLGFVSSSILVLAFPPHNQWYLSFVGLIPLLFAVVRAKSILQVFVAGFTCAVFFIMLGLHWVSYSIEHYGNVPSYIAEIITILFAVVEEPQFFIWAILLFLLYRKGKIFGFKEKKHSVLLRKFFLIFTFIPSSFIAIDFIYPKIFPTTLGQCLYPWFSFVQISEIVGVYGLTYPIVLCNVLLFCLIGAGLQKNYRLGLYSFISLSILGFSLLSASRWGFNRIQEVSDLQNSYERLFKVSLIQGNIGDIDKISSERGYEPAIDFVLGTYERLSIKAKLDFNPDLIVWPETAYPLLYTHFESLHSNFRSGTRDTFILELVKKLDTSLLFGGYSQNGKQDFNSAFLIERHQNKTPFLSDTYLKYAILPFAEYVPLGPLAPYILEVIPNIANFGRGPGPRSIPVSTEDGPVHIAPQICYEGILPKHSIQATQLGTDVHLNLTNDSWFGPTAEPELHLLLTLFRAIETRRPIVRSTNTGISVYADMTGKIVQKTELFKASILNIEVPIAASTQTRPVTFFVRHGDPFSIFFIAISVIGLVFIIGPLKKKLTV